ncbi:hypothetical protein ACA910_009532 [Epithemia clementina (nom. ined.)]
MEDRYIPTTITTEIVGDDNDDDNEFYQEDRTPRSVTSSLSPTYYQISPTSAASTSSKSANKNNPHNLPSLLLNNACLVPGDLRRLSKQIGYPLHTVSIKYCYVKHFHRKKVHEPKLLAELLDILHEASPHLVCLKLQGPFPRNTADTKRILTELTTLPDDDDDDHRDENDDDDELTGPGPVTPNLQDIVMAVPEDAHIPIIPQWRDLMMGNPQLERLRLESFDLSDGFYQDPDTKAHLSSVINLVKALKHATGLQELHLGGCRIQDKGLWDLVKGLDYMKQYRVFRIPRCSSLTYISLLTTASLLQLNTNLQVLDLTGNKSLFAHVAPPTMADAIATGTAVPAINPNDVKACENALTHFLRSLQNNSTLVELHLNYCGMNDNAFQFLLCALERNRKLAVLNLNYNQITRKVGLEEHLVDALPSLKGLLHLSLEGLVRRRNHHHRKKTQQGASSHDDGDSSHHANSTVLTHDAEGQATKLSALLPWEKRFLEALDDNSSLGSLILDEDTFHNNALMFREIQSRLERNLEWQRDQKLEQRLRHSPTAAASTTTTTAPPADSPSTQDCSRCM